MMDYAEIRGRGIARERRRGSPRSRGRKMASPLNSAVRGIRRRWKRRQQGRQLRLPLAEQQLQTRKIKGITRNNPHKECSGRSDLLSI
ncbi:hypothetical protein ACMD2_11353 [Ananas comosus]|uniref:Uncharacterized protein n=1 Tax=Ananas comosus TaxID=4615 RepID=A0A199UFN4_ANACO|nr:hypothetical protein ACMD2_11353 [Ananas comosus]